MSFTRSEPALAQVIEDPEQLVEYFRVAEKPEEQHRVGTEAEKIGVYVADASPIPYEGPRGIGALLAKLAAHHEFETMVEGENLLGLASNDATITLEPGGQLELSGAPQHSLFET